MSPHVCNRTTIIYCTRFTIPRPTTNAEFTDALARALHRPRFLAAPKVLIRTALGELAEQLVGDVYVVPRRLIEDGFVFGAPDVQSTVAAALTQMNALPSRRG